MQSTEETSLTIDFRRKVIAH